MLRIGDRVVVYKKVIKEMGFNNTWVAIMDNAIGQEFIILGADNAGVRLRGHHCLFPLGSLRRVDQRPEDEEPL